MPGSRAIPRLWPHFLLSAGVWPGTDLLARQTQKLLSARKLVLKTKGWNYPLFGVELSLSKVVSLVLLWLTNDSRFQLDTNLWFAVVVSGCEPLVLVQGQWEPPP